MYKFSTYSGFFSNLPPRESRQSTQSTDTFKEDAPIDFSSNENSTAEPAPPDANDGAVRIRIRNYMRFNEQHERNMREVLQSAQSSDSKVRR